MRPGWDVHALEQVVDSLHASPVAVDLGTPASEIGFASDEQRGPRARDLYGTSGLGPDGARRTRRREVRARPGEVVDPRARAAEDQAEGRPALG